MSAFGGRGEQFGGAGQIPVGVAGLAVPEPGGQQRQDRGGIAAAGVGVEHGGDRKGVPQIVRPRAARTRSHWQPSLGYELPECLVNDTGAQPVTSGGDQQRRTSHRGQHLAAQLQVLRQRSCGALVQWEFACLAVFSGHGQGARLPVQVEPMSSPTASPVRIPVVAISAIRV